MTSIIFKAIEKSTPKEMGFEKICQMLANLLARTKYNDITKDCNYCLRKRKFDLYTYIVIAIMAYYLNISNITQDLLCSLYNEETGMNITPQAINKQLKKDDTIKAIAEFTNRLLSEAINFVNFRQSANTPS